MSMPARRRRLPRVLLSGLLLGLVGACMVLASGGPAAAQAKGKGKVVEVDGTAALKWEPATGNLQPGDSVKFTVKGGPPHPVGSGNGPTDDKRFDASACTLAKMSKVGDSCTVKFDKAGSYPFFCEVHLSLGMKGIINVGTTGGGGGGGGGQSSATPSVADTPTAVSTPTGKPGIYYGGYLLLGVGALLALAALGGYVRYAPDFRRRKR